MKVINLIGASNTGKSTATYGLLYTMKKLGLNVEYASEYAKDMVYEKRGNILQDQLYILAKQNRKLSRLEVMGVEYAVTDTCLLLGNVYAPKLSRLEVMGVEYAVTDTCLLLGNVYAPDDALPELKAVITAYFNQYDNTTFYLPPNESFAFSGIGRVQQNRDESNALVSKIEAVLPDNVIRLDKANDYVSPIIEHLGFSTDIVYPWSLLHKIREIEMELKDLKRELLNFKG